MDAWQPSADDVAKSKEWILDCIHAVAPKYVYLCGQITWWMALKLLPPDEEGTVSKKFKVNLLASLSYVTLNNLFKDAANSFPGKERHRSWLGKLSRKKLVPNLKFTELAPAGKKSPAHYGYVSSTFKVRLLGHPTFDYKIGVTLGKDLVGEEEVDDSVIESSAASSDQGESDDDSDNDE